MKQSQPTDPLTVKCLYCGARRGHKCHRFGPFGPQRIATTHRARQLRAAQVGALRKHKRHR